MNISPPIVDLLPPQENTVILFNASAVATFSLSVGHNFVQQFQIALSSPPIRTVFAICMSIKVLCMHLIVSQSVPARFITLCQQLVSTSVLFLKGHVDVEKTLLKRYEGV